MRRTPAGGLRATVSVGGHPLPVVLRADGRVEAVGRPGSILGWVPDPTLRDAEVELGPHDALVLYTDGVSEARTADGMLGDARLYSVLEGAAGEDAGAIASRLERATMEVGNPRDDVAVVVLRPAAALDAQEAA
jgi:serine phosphatase RsbU (regulator of sigma subunit)